MNYYTYKLPSPVGFQLLPEQNILEGMPADTDVICFGKDHSNLFQRMSIHEHFPALKEAGFEMIALESLHTRQVRLERSLHELSGDPAQMDRDKLPESRTDNYFASGTVTCGFSRFQMLRRGMDLGMDIACVDNRDFDDPRKAASSEAMFGSNTFMAEKISALGKKLIYLGGYEHLYNVKREDDVSSIQGLLQQQGLKTYTIGMTTFKKHILTKQYDNALIRKDPQAAKMVIKDYQENHDAVSRRSNILTYDLHDVSPNAGRTIPDKILVFPYEGEQWLQEQAFITRYTSYRETEAEMWHAIHDVRNGVTKDRYVVPIAD